MLLFESSRPTHSYSKMVSNHHRRKAIHRMSWKPRLYCCWLRWGMFNLLALRLIPSSCWYTFAEMESVGVRCGPIDPNLSRKLRPLRVATLLLMWSTYIIFSGCHTALTNRSQGTAPQTQALGCKVTLFGHILTHLNLEAGLGTQGSAKAQLLKLLTPSASPTRRRLFTPTVPINTQIPKKSSLTGRLPPAASLAYL